VIKAAPTAQDLVITNATDASIVGTFWIYQLDLKHVRPNVVVFRILSMGMTAIRFTRSVRIVMIYVWLARREV
jgi:hypothetical protein